MVMRRPPALEAPAALLAIADDLTLAGQSASLVARDAMAEVLQVGRVGLLVEYPQAQGDAPVTLAQAQAAGRRPYVTTWAAESIRQWQTARVNGAVQPVLVVLCEDVEVQGADAYAPECVEQLRELRLEPEGYVQRLWRQDAQGKWVQYGADVVPLRAGGRVPYIPFLVVGPNEISMRVQKPPMLDLACVNLGHYKNTADLEHGAHFTGLPTAVVSGYRAEDDEVLSIGSTEAWVFPAPDAKATYLEFSGQGLGALENRCTAKEA